MDEKDLNLTPKMALALPVIRRVFKQYAPENFKLEFTAGKEWFHHGMWSLHHSGNAVDIRTRTLPDRGVGVISVVIAHLLQAALTKEFGNGVYAVLYNDQGPRAPHLHVQYNQGGRWSTPGDFPTNPKSARLA